MPAAGKMWVRRMPAVLHLARVIASAKDAGSFDPQMMPAHQAAAMAGRVARFARMQKAQPVGPLAKAAPVSVHDWLDDAPLRKAIPLMAAANVASMVLPAAASSRWGRRAMSWGVRNTLRAGRAFGRMTGGAARAPRTVMAPGPTLGGAGNGVKLRAGRSTWGKFRRNPGRAGLALNRGIYNNRGSVALAAGGALGGYEADQAWRRATPKQRMMGDV